MAGSRGVLRVRECREAGIHPEVLRRLCRKGKLLRVGRGLYALAGGEIHANRTLVEASRLVPRGVVCLLSALRFHGITSQAPYEVWMAIHPKAWKPRSTDVPIRFVRFSGPALSEGVERHEIEGVPVGIYSPAKTVADCFRYRNKIGLDVALEALREGWREQRFTMDELWRHAKDCRVSTVIRPYLESLE